MSMRKLVAGSVAVLVSMAGVNAGIVFQEEFYIDGVTRTENMSTHNTTVGSTTTGLAPTSYIWANNGGGKGLNAAYVVLGAGTTGVGCVLWPQGDGNNVSAIANNAPVSGSSGGIYTLTTTMSMYDAGVGYVGFSVGGVAHNFWTQTGDALFVRLYGQAVELVKVTGGTRTVLETMTGKNTGILDDTITLVYNADAGTVTGSFLNSDSTLSSFGTYSVGTLNFNAVKYQMDNVASENTNYPRIMSTRLDVIPEPATIGLFMISSAGLLLFRRMRR